MVEHCYVTGVVCWIVSLVALAQSQTPPDTALLNTLLSNYDTRTPPIVPGSPMEVKMDIAIMAIISVVEDEETVTYKQLRTMGWSDHRLRWNPADHFGIAVLMIPADALWLPEVFSPHINSMEKTNDNSQVVMLTADGTLGFTVYEIVNAKCNFDVRNFPKDIQTCEIPYSSISFPNNMMLLRKVVGSKIKDSCEDLINPEWNVLKCEPVEDHLAVTSGILGTVNVSRVVHSFTFERKAGFYIVTQSLQGSIITCVTIVGLFSPTSHLRERGERVNIGLAGLLALSVVFVTVAEYLPKNFAQFPKLGTFLMLEIFVCVGCTFIAVGVMFMHVYCEKTGSIPTWLQWLADDEEPADKKQSMIDRSAELKTSMERQLREILDSIRDYLHELRQAEAASEIATTLCFRLDCIFLAVMFIFNIILTLIFAMG